MFQSGPRNADHDGDALRRRVAELETLSGVLREQARRADAAVAESEARCRLTLDSVADAVITTDPAGRVTGWNAGAVRMLRWTEAEVLWRDAGLIFMPADRAAGVLEAEMQAAVADGAVASERWYARRDGTRVWAQGRLAALRVAGGLRGYLRVLHDRTGGEASAEALRAAEAAVHHAQKMETVGHLAGGLAHDVNNQLQAISGALDMMQYRAGQGRAAEAGRYVEGARLGVDRAASLTRRLLAFARRRPVQPERVDPDAVVRGLADLIARTAGPRIRVELRLCGDAGPVLCDPSGLENAVLNLAINARDAMPGGGALTISTRRVSLDVADAAAEDGAPSGDYVEVAVADEGMGMDEATRARAFEPFFTTKPAGQGTGLGLAQVGSFARQSGGAVRLDSAPGQGTTVRVRLPRHGEGAAAGRS
jgi:PAS domain S-box-containing protein